MKMLSTLLLVLGMNTLILGQKFARQVYILSDHFIKEKCEVDAACDCCASDLIFLTKKQFALVDRCLYNDTYLRGRYSIKNKSLSLKFRPVVVSQIYDNEEQVEKNEKKHMNMAVLTLQIKPCGEDSVTLEHATIKEYKYGSRRKGIKEKEIIRQLKKSTGWRLTSI